MAVPQGLSSAQQGQEYFLSKGVNGISPLPTSTLMELVASQNSETLDPFLMETHALHFLWKLVKINPMKCGAGRHKGSTEMIGSDIGKAGERKGSSNSWCLIPVADGFRACRDREAGKKSNNPGNLFCASMEAAVTKF